MPLSAFTAFTTSTTSSTATPSRRSLLRVFAMGATASLVLVACSEQNSAQAPARGSVKPEQSYDLLAKEGKGFVAGALMGANTVYVLFDPQCPHCGHLWERTLPLHKQVKFVWIPVAFISPKSAPQGAALLTAANPVEAMGAHEASLLAGAGGSAASSSIPEDIAAAIKKNTDLFNSMGVESVPYIVAKNASTGQVVTNAGSMETPALAQFLGLN
jgi:thiol:disulfide interchange protein DsbG